MYCSKCGEADQTVNSYCRKCGDFLIDNLSKFSLINQILGIDSPQKQITVSLIMNIFSFVFSLLLILYLIGYMNGVERATGQSSPNIFPFYILIGLNAVWQLINVIFSINLMIKMNRTPSNIHQTSDEINAELKNSEARDYLPPADLQNVIPSVVEVTTRNLEKVGRK
jgi:uncharacterized membrane protein YuzA (DUF378 family)